MNSILDLLKLSLDNSDQLSFNTLLQTFDDTKVFQKQISDIEPLISYLNSFLNVSTDFENGLKLLKVVLSQCNSDILGKHLLQWLQLCTKGLRFHNLTGTLFNVLRELIIYSKDFPDVRKETSLTVIPKFLEHFFKTTISLLPQNEIPFLACLDEILQTYGKVCNNWKRKIEQYLLSKLESPIGIVHYCAKCFLDLAAIGPHNSGNKADNFIGGISSKELNEDQWSYKQLFLITLLHAQLDELFLSINEIQGIYEEYLVKYDKNYSIPEISTQSPLRKAQILCNYFESLSHFLGVMLLGRYPLEKAVDDEAVFSVICRGLSINCKTLESNITNDSIILSTLVPSIQTACLSILEALIKSCRQDVIKDGEIICKLLTQTLKWTSENVEYGLIKPFGELRVKAYSCLSDWLTVSRTCSSVQPYINDLIPQILADIHYERPSITLNVSSKQLKSKISKKERKKKLKLSNPENKPPVVVNPTANKDVCESALHLVSALWNSSFIDILPKFHKQLQECIINELMVVQISMKVSTNLPIPYSDESCRLGLFKALLSICNNYHPALPAPCNYALPIFATGLNDHSLKISRFCSQAAGNIEILLHSVAPSLNCPLQLSSEISKSSQRENVSQIFQIQNDSINNSNLERGTSVIESVSSLFERNIEATPSETKSNGLSAADDGVVTERNGDGESNAISSLSDHDYVKKQMLQNQTSTSDVTNQEKNDVSSPLDTRNLSSEILEVENESSFSTKANKRSKTDDSEKNHSILEKRIKHNNCEESEKQINILESEMLSSFVDIVD